jgi:hypothetical protein
MGLKALGFGYGLHYFGSGMGGGSRGGGLVNNKRVYLRVKSTASCLDILQVYISSHALYLCVSQACHNKQPLFPLQH